MDKGGTKREILDAALELFSVQGYGATSVSQIADAVGIRIIGDIPIYVAMDSSDVWSEPENFQLDENNVPTEVSGVPPDYFSADGQLWGNPLYDYEAMQKNGFEWWIRRIGGATKLYDVIRIDHFRGFESYWAVPYGETTAKNGHWVKGPGTGCGNWTWRLLSGEADKRLAKRIHEMTRIYGRL